MAALMLSHDLLWSSLVVKASAAYSQINALSLARHMGSL